MSIHSDNPRENQEVYSQKVLAGKRTYFFDVNLTKRGDYYLVITEKKQDSENDQRPKKSKLFVFKEDLNKFVAALQKTTDHIKQELLPDYDFDKFPNVRDDEPAFPTDQD